jgi:two-component system alkaline phosphatase synthesis response regulator PhoP
MRDVWGEGWWGPTKTLDVHVNGLRSKLGEHAARIVTVRGVGYRLDPSAEA